MTDRRNRVPWESSDRRSRLPANWFSEIRPAVLKRDRYQCQLRYEDVCIGRATEADHKQAGDDHRIEACQAACRPCHRVKSSREGAAARPRLNRPTETHPSLR